MEICEVGITFGHPLTGSLMWECLWVVSDGELALFSRETSWHDAKPWGPRRWCMCPTRLERSCARLFAMGWRECSTVTTTGARSRSALTVSCWGRFPRGSTRRLSCGRGWDFGGRTDSRSFSRDGNNKDVASLNLASVMPPVITLLAL